MQQQIFLTNVSHLPSPDNPLLNVEVTPFTTFLEKNSIFIMSSVLLHAVTGNIIYKYCDKNTVKTTDSVCVTYLFIILIF